MRPIAGLRGTKEADRRRTPGVASRLASSLFALALTLLPGCTTKAIRGLVVEGPTAEIQVVSKNDQRLQRPGIEGAMIEMVVDPGSMRPKPLAPATSDEQGHFETPIDEAGAGFLEYELMVIARGVGYTGASANVPVPGPDKRLLITLPPGRERVRPPQDILNETIETGEKLMESR